MMPISGVNTGAAQSLTAAEKVLGVAENRKSGKEAQGRVQKPSMDVHIPEEKQEPFGRYWMGKDKDGCPKIYFDDPEQEADIPERLEDVPNAKKTDEVSTSAERPGQSPDAEEPEGSGKKEERWMGDTAR